MVGVERRKKDIISTINQNPTKVTITIVEKKLVEGESKNITNEKEAIVRIFHDNETVEQNTSLPRASYDVTRRYAMLMDSTINLPITPQSYIELSSVYGVLRSSGIYPQIVRNEICGYQIDVKRLD